MHAEHVLHAEGEGIACGEMCVHNVCGVQKKRGEQGGVSTASGAA